MEQPARAGVLDPSKPATLRRYRLPEAHSAPLTDDKG
jgi:hypothetical protein